ncbi:hypothetical protein GCM10025734_71700 [Kitasatospora paranensis]
MLWPCSTRREVRAVVLAEVGTRALLDAEIGLALPPARSVGLDDLVIAGRGFCWSGICESGSGRAPVKAQEDVLSFGIDARLESVCTTTWRRELTPVAGSSGACGPKYQGL